MLCGGEARIVVWSALHDLAILGQIFAARAERVLDGAHRPIEHSPHLLPFIADEFRDQLPALG